MFKKTTLLLSLLGAFMFSSASYANDNKSCATDSILGAIIGGVIGNQFGGGHGKDALTAAGALLGGSIGNDSCQEANERQNLIPLPVHPLPVYPAPVWGPGNLYGSYGCQVVTETFQNGYGGYYTQWHQVCN